MRAFLATRQTPLRARARLKRQRAAIAAVLERVHEWLTAREPGAEPPATDGPRPSADTDAGHEVEAKPPGPPPAPDDPGPQAETAADPPPGGE